METLEVISAREKRTHSLLSNSLSMSVLVVAAFVATSFTVNSRIDSVNSRIDSVNVNLDSKIEALSNSVDHRFEAVDERLDRIEVNIATILTTLQTIQNNQIKGSN